MKKMKKLVPVLLLATLLAGCVAPAAPAAAATPPTTMAETLPEPTETAVRETEAPAPARVLPDGCYTVDFETENDGCRFIDFLRGANHFLELAKMNAAVYDEKMEKKLIAYMSAIRTFGISSYYDLNDEETDLTEVCVSNSRWTVRLKHERDGMWVRYISKTNRMQCSSFDETISTIHFQRYDNAGNDNLSFTGLDIGE